MTLRTLETLQIDNRFARLSGDYFSRVQPTPLPDPHLLHFNREAAALIDLDPREAQRPEFAAIFLSTTTTGRSMPGASRVQRN